MGSGRRKSLGLTPRSYFPPPRAEAAPFPGPLALSCGCLVFLSGAPPVSPGPAEEGLLGLRVQERGQRRFGAGPERRPYPTL